jgi:hypothetical protein
MRANIDPEVKLAIIEIVDERIRELQVRRSDFLELKAIVEGLAATQVEVEKTLNALASKTDDLAAAQARTDKSVEALVAAQARTDKSLEALVAAQARTDKSLEALAAAQARTDKSVEALAAAQARTEQAVQALAKQVGRLSDHVGFGLEDIARVVAPGYLLRHYGIEMAEFKRHFVKANGQQFEIDLYAEGRRNAQKLVILGEVKSRIYSREVKQFARTLKRLKPHLSKETFGLLFGYWIHPAASIEAQKHGIELIASYQR